MNIVVGIFSTMCVGVRGDSQFLVQGMWGCGKINNFFYSVRGVGGLTVFDTLFGGNNSFWYIV